jgi:hypothetical protein
MMTDDDPTFDLTGALPFDSDADASTPQKQGATARGVRDFAYIGRGLTADEFRLYVQGYHFGTTPPDYIVLHHTAIPSATWARYPSGAVWDAGEAGMGSQQIYAKRLRQLGQLRTYYRDSLGWTRGPHLFIDERYIWLMTPLYDVGIHAAQGNSYRDSSGKLHYSVGIEVVGFYERVRWPPQVAANVRAAVHALHDTLKNFDYIDKKWSGGISSHRNYNKPRCPGAAIVPSYYIPVLRGIGDGERPEHVGLRHYKVLPAVTGGATMRTGPAQGAAIMGRLKAGDDFWGEPVEGQRWYIEGFGHGSIWIRSDDQRCIWANLLEEVKQS